MPTPSPAPSPGSSDPRRQTTSASPDPISRQPASAPRSNFVAPATSVHVQTSAPSSIESWDDEDADDMRLPMVGRAFQVVTGAVTLAGTASALYGFSQLREAINVAGSGFVLLGLGCAAAGALAFRRVTLDFFYD